MTVGNRISFQKIRRFFLPPYIVGFILSVLYLVTPSFQQKTNLYFILIGFVVLYIMKTTGFYEDHQPVYYYETKRTQTKKKKPKKGTKEKERRDDDESVIFSKVSFYLPQSSVLPIHQSEIRINRSSFSIILPSNKKEMRRRILIDYKRIISIKKNEKREDSLLISWLNLKMNQVFECELNQKNPSTSEEEEDSEENTSPSEKLYQILFYYTFILLNEKERTEKSPQSVFDSLPIIIPPEPSRKIFFLLNKTSGKGNSVERFYDNIYPHIKKIQGIDTFKIFLTNYKGHAFDIFSKFNFSEFNEVCVCGGDGTFKEVIDGFMNHEGVEDFKTIFSSRIRLSTIPLGSGNGLAHEITGNEDLLNSFLVLSRGRFMGLDIKVLFYSHAIDVNRNYTLRKLDEGRPEIIRNFECCGTFANLGSTADVNHQTEKWRWVGPRFKFLLASVYVLLRNVSYKMNLKFIVPSLDGNLDGEHYKRNKYVDFGWENIYAIHKNEEEDKESERSRNESIVPNITKYFGDEFFGSVITKENEEQIFKKFRISRRKQRKQEEEEESEGEDDEEEDDNDDRDDKVIEMKDYPLSHFVCANFKKLTRHLWGPIYNNVSDGYFDIQHLPSYGRLSSGIILNKIFVKPKKQRYDQIEVPVGYHPFYSKNQVLKHFRSKAFVYQPICDFVRCSVDGEIRYIRKGEIMIGEVMNKLVRIAADEEKVY